MKNATILLCYGIFEEPNTNYKNYLDQALNVIKSNKSDQVIVCGGFTNKNFSKSEAATVSEYLQKSDKSLASKIVLEEKSITTPQNLEFARDIVKSFEVKPESFTVICDSIRAPKVYYLALSHFSSLLPSTPSEEQIYYSLLTQSVEKRTDVTQKLELKYENITIMGVNLDRSPREIGDQIIASMEEVAAHNYPSINELILTLKKKQFEI